MCLDNPLDASVTAVKSRFKYYHTTATGFPVTTREPLSSVDVFYLPK